MVAFARRTLGRPGEAEDVAQDVFLRVWSAAPRWQAGRARFTTWLYRVTMNVCLDRLAKKREVVMDEVPDVADPHPEPNVAVHATQVARHVHAALAALPDAQRIAVT